MVGGLKRFYRRSISATRCWLTQSRANGVNGESLEEEEDQELTEPERIALRASWSSDFDVMYGVGADIYTQIFRQQPQLSRVFTYLEDYKVDDDGWMHKKEFRKQALRFVQSLDRCVSFLPPGEPRYDELDAFLLELGQRHKAFAERGFNAGHLINVDSAISIILGRRIDTLDLDVQTAADAKSAWRKLSSRITRRMALGFAS